MPPSPSRPTLIVNPLDDVVFAQFAQLLVDHGVMSAADFELRLRTEYPQATVHARELASETWVVWYVYRDGHWVPTNRVAESGAGHAP